MLRDRQTRFRRVAATLIAIASVFACLSGPLQAKSPQRAVDFERHVAPIFLRHSRVAIILLNLPVA